MITNLVWHGYSFTIDKGEDFIIIHHRVHWLNPQGIHGSIK